MSGNKMALDALTAALDAMEHMANTLNNMDAVDEDEDAQHDAAFEAVRAAIAALQAEPQPAPVHPNHRADLRYVRKVLDDVRSLALTEGDKLCGDVDAAINGMDYIIKRTEGAAALPATPPKD